MSNLPPLNSLRAFEASARLGSFTRAAEELNVTQAAVSQQVKVLEHSLKTALFIRESKGIRLTEAGALLCSLMPSQKRDPWRYRGWYWASPTFSSSIIRQTP